MTLLIHAKQRGRSSVRYQARARLAHVSGLSADRIDDSVKPTPVLRPEGLRCLAPRLVVELREPPFPASVGFHDVHLTVAQEGDRPPVG